MKHREYVGRSRSPLLLVLALAAVGCGPAYTILPLDPSDHRPRLRDSTIARVGGCLEQYAMQIEPGAYRMDFRIEVTQDGKFEWRKVTGPEGPSVHLELQSCIRIALKAAVVQAEVFQAASVTPESRRYMGVADAAAPSVALRPIRIAANGVTIGVYVTVTTPAGAGIFVPIHKPSHFPFVIIVKDDGKGKGGGWQEAKASLPFQKVILPITVITWYCGIRIGMPIRNSKMGYISPTAAATMSAKVTNSAASNTDFNLPQGIFCNTFRKNVETAFPAMYPDLGAKVGR